MKHPSRVDTVVYLCIYLRISLVIICRMMDLMAFIVLRMTHFSSTRTLNRY